MDIPNNPPAKEVRKAEKIPRSTMDAMSDVLKPDPRGLDTRDLERQDQREFVKNKIENQDSISSILIPEDWTENLSSSPRRIANSQLRLFSTLNKDAHIYFWDAGVPISEQTHTAFAEVLAPGAHLLKSQEISTLSQSLKQLFALTAPQHEQVILLTAKIEQLNGKNVLVVHSKIADSNKEIMAVYWDATESGDKPEIQAIAFQGEGKSYAENIFAARKCFNSIVWR